MPPLVLGVTGVQETALPEAGVGDRGTFQTQSRLMQPGLSSRTKTLAPSPPGAAVTAHSLGAVPTWPQSRLGVSRLQEDTGFFSGYECLSSLALTEH